MSSVQRLIRVEENSASYPAIVRPVAPTEVRYLPKARPQALSRKQLITSGLLIGALAFGGLQAVRCTVGSAMRLQNLVTKQSAVAQIQRDAQSVNSTLKDKIALYRSPVGIEEMARERLNLVGQDEVLVRIFPAGVAQAPKSEEISTY